MSSSVAPAAGDADQHDPLPEGALDERAGLAAELAEAAAVGLVELVGTRRRVDVDLGHGDDHRRRDVGRADRSAWTVVADVDAGRRRPACAP